MSNEQRFRALASEGQIKAIRRRCEQLRDEVEDGLVFHAANEIEESAEALYRKLAEAEARCQQQLARAERLAETILALRDGTADDIEYELDLHPMDLRDQTGDLPAIEAEADDMDDLRRRLAEAEARCQQEREDGYRAALDDVLHAIAGLRGDAGVARLVNVRRGEFKNTLTDEELDTLQEADR